MGSHRNMPSEALELMSRPRPQPYSEYQVDGRRQHRTQCRIQGLGFGGPKK